MEETQGTLVEYGQSFQVKTMATLVGDRKFMEQVADIVDPKSFDSESAQWIVKTTIQYFKEYRDLPTLDVFKIELDKVKSEPLKAGVVANLRTVYQQREAADLNFIKHEFLKFCRNQQMKNAIFASVDLLEKGNYDEIKKIVDKAMHAGLERSVGHDWRLDVDKRVVENSRNTIATPWPVVNKIMDGGLGPGELGCIVAPSGIGKSWILRAISGHALKIGKNVADYTFELNENYVGLRYDTIFTGIEPSKIKHNVEKVRKVIDEMAGDLIIKYFPPKTTNCIGLQAHVNRLVTVGFTPDLMIIDYADLLRSNEKSDARYLELGSIYEELRGLGGELGVPVWTASQSQRSSIQEDVIQADKIAESYSKIMTADFVMSISRKVNDKVSNTARAHVIKNRFGPDGMTFPVKMDTATGQFDIYDENSPNGMIAKRQMADSGNIVKKMLADKYNATRSVDLSDDISGTSSFTLPDDDPYGFGVGAE